MNEGLTPFEKCRDQSRLVGAFFVCSLFPFLSPVPVGTDTQPLFLVFAMIVVLHQAWHVGLRGEEYLLLGLAALSLLYINPLGGYDVDAGKAVSMVSGVLTLIAASRLNDERAYQWIKIASLVYFSYSCLIYLNSAFFLGLQENFVRAVNVEDLSSLAYRGAPALATEPGLLGGLLVFLLIQLQYYGSKTSAPAKQVFMYGVVIVLTIFMTKSGTGYLYLLIFLMVAYGRYVLRNWLGGALALTVLGSFLAFVVPVLADLGLDNRGADILIGLYSGENLGDDTSVLKRLYDLRIGFESLLECPFGVGVNGVSAAINDVALRHGLLRVNDIGGEISLVSGLSWFVVAYGVWGLLFVCYVFFFRSRAPALHKVFALIYFSVSFSPAFPAIWILLSQPLGKRCLPRSDAVR